ncbi:MAG TPA: sulfotransferase [Tepidisphaeraceae bacterium]|jgi:tetratricopeptide (TPR) repeat protein|nr:sulfotransferase [Tepidisphaeraceae bacterium]
MAQVFPVGETAGSVGERREGAARAKRESAAGESLFRAGDYRRAAAHFTEAARLQPGNAIHHFHLACACWHAGDLDKVDGHFLAALARQPNNPDIHEKMAWWFVQQGRVAKALEHGAMAMKLAPQRASACVTHADALWTDGQYEAAWNLLQPIASAGQGGFWGALVFAKMARRFSQQPQAIAAVERELRVPNLQRVERARLLYCGAGLLDAVGRFDEAFDFARRANELDARPFDAAMSTGFTDQRISYYTASQMDSLPRANLPSNRVLLIVGMPRSGTSLVEQILASHPAVHGGGELTYLYEAAATAERSEWAEGKLFPRCWDDLSVNRANSLAAGYLDRHAKINSTATYVTDKMPTNFQYLATAELLLPQCRVIHCVRDPRDTCLSCYFTDFAIGHEFAFDLSHLAAYYRDYQRMMDHWKKVLRIPILDVRYEDVVGDPEAQVRRMLDFANLPFDEACLTPHRNRRPVATSSRDQVRKPIYSSSIGRWKNYRKYIPQLLELGGN